MTSRHGINVVEVNDGVRPIRTVATSIIGFPATADDADADLFPLNTPVLLSDVRGSAGRAGDSGTLAATLEDISEQSNPLAVVVRVEDSADPAQLEANVIGADNAGSKTGLQALFAAQNKFNVRPRILGAPGLDTLNVATALISTAKRLGGMAYLSANGADSKEDAVAYRGNFAAREAMVLWPSFTSRRAAAVVLGLRSAIDADPALGWNKTISNVAVGGVTGIDEPVSFDLDASQVSDAAFLNDNEVTTLINYRGFRFWGSRTCSDDPLFAFESATRTAQILKDTIIESQFINVDGRLVAGLAQDIVESINTKFRNLVNTGRIIGASAWLDDKVNTPDQLAAGKLFIDYDFTPTPPLENISFRQRITNRHFVDFNLLNAA